jgi:hypothetical protein
LRACPHTLLILDDHWGPLSAAPLAMAGRLPPLWLHVLSVSSSLGPDCRVAVVSGTPDLVQGMCAHQALGPRAVSRWLQGLVAQLWRQASRGRGRGSWQHMAGSYANWLGELSNATFHADMAPLLDDPQLDGISFAGLEDLGAFLKAALRAPLGYLNEHLGYFRTSASQNSADPMGRPMKLAHLAYVALTMAGRRLGQLEPAAAQANLARLCPLIAERYGAQADMAALCAVMPGLAEGSEAAEAQFLALWHVYSGAAARKPLPPPA